MKLYECTEHYFYRIFDINNDNLIDEGVAKITSYVDNGDSVSVEFEEDNSWTLDKQTTGSSISIGTQGLKCFFGSTLENLEKGINDYKNGNYVDIT